MIKRVTQLFENVSLMQNASSGISSSQRGRELSLSLVRKEVTFFFFAGLFVLVIIRGYRFFHLFFLLSPLKSLKTDAPGLNLFQLPW